ncbi:MAG: hypothetical protein P8Y45_21790 [Exilibacterium sp.]
MLRRAHAVAQKGQQKGSNINSCSGELGCKAKETAWPYEISESGDKRKWVNYQCRCSTDGSKFEFLGPASSWGEPYNPYGVYQYEQPDAWGNWRVKQVIETFSVDPNVNIDAWYSDFFYKTDFIRAFKTNNQVAPNSNQKGGH